MTTENKRLIHYSENITLPLEMRLFTTESDDPLISLNGSVNHIFITKTAEVDKKFLSTVLPGDNYTICFQQCKEDSVRVAAFLQMNDEGKKRLIEILQSV